MPLQTKARPEQSQPQQPQHCLLDGRDLGRPAVEFLGAAQQVLPTGPTGGS